MRGSVVILLGCVRLTRLTRWRLQQPAGDTLHSRGQPVKHSASTGAGVYTHTAWFVGRQSSKGVNHIHSTTTQHTATQYSCAAINDWKVVTASSTKLLEVALTCSSIDL